MAASACRVRLAPGNARMPSTSSRSRPDNGAMRGELTHGRLIAILAMGAVAFGAAAWLLLGPLWTIAGVLVGPLIAIVVVAGVRGFASPDAATLLSNDQPGE